MSINKLLHGFSYYNYFQVPHIKPTWYTTLHIDMVSDIITIIKCIHICVISAHVTTVIVS